VASVPDTVSARSPAAPPDTGAELPTGPVSRTAATRFSNEHLHGIAATIGLTPGKAA